jgi:hypothetical protein
MGDRTLLATGVTLLPEMRETSERGFSLDANSCVMTPTQNLLLRLKTEIEKVQRCSAVLERTEHVKEQTNNQTIWEGDVGVFWITSPTTRATRCYGWCLEEAQEFITMLHLPPIDSAHAAVRAALPSIRRQMLPLVHQGAEIGNPKFAAISSKAASGVETAAAEGHNVSMGPGGTTNEGAVRFG